jgi:hypothetical protein
VPDFPDEDRVQEHHLVTARVMLDEFGIADPSAFDAKLQKAAGSCILIEVHSGSGTGHR